MNSLLFEEPIRGTEDLCLHDAGVGVEFHGYKKSSSLQLHCPGTAEPVVIVVIL
jgi:hypothetical protein